MIKFNIFSLTKKLTFCLALTKLLKSNIIVICIFITTIRKKKGMTIHEIQIFRHHTRDHKTC